LSRNNPIAPALLTSILLTVGIGLLLLVLFGQVPGDRRWAAVLGDAAHGPVFGLFAVIVIGLLRRLRAPATPVRDYLIAFAVALAAGSLIELAQRALNRDASLDDLLRNALGAVTGIALFAVFDQELRKNAVGQLISRSGILIGGIGAALLLVPLVTTVWAYVVRDRDFPQLVDFDSLASTYFIATYSAVTVERERISAVLADGADRDVGLRARVSIRKRWAIVLWEPSPDWRNFKQLALDILNPTDTTLLLLVRIRDGDERGTRPAVDLGAMEVPPRSRATRRIPLQPQVTDGDTYVDFGAIRGLILRHHPANRAQEFYLMRIWLE
jgi:glycopeptide antibiotics resistance protein